MQILFITIIIIFIIILNYFDKMYNVKILDNLFCSRRYLKDIILINDTDRYIIFFITKKIMDDIVVSKINYLQLLQSSVA